MRASLPSRERRRDRAAGFLLTETLATFTISAFVLLGLVSASSVLLRSVDNSVARIQNGDDLGRTMRALERDISGLTRARWNGYEPQAFVFRGGPNSLFFASADRSADGVNETHVVALREIIVSAGTRLMRGDARLSPRAAGFDDLHFGPQRELGTGAARLRFYYLPPAQGNIEPGRLRAWPFPRKLPAAIIIEAVARDNGRLILSTRVPIHANADIGCLAKDSAKMDFGSLSAPEPAAPKASDPTTIDAAASAGPSQAPPDPAGGLTATNAPPSAFCALEAAKSKQPNPEAEPDRSPSSAGTAP